MGDDWYCRIAGVERGPLPYPAVVDLARSSRLSPQDEVRFGSEGPWTRADSVSGLFVADDAVAESDAPAATENQPEHEFARDLSEFPIESDSSAGVVSVDDIELAHDPYVEDWHAKSLGLEFGPIPFGELLGMAARGVLTATDRVRRATSDQWKPAGSIPAVKQALATVHPMPNAPQATPRSSATSSSPAPASAATVESKVAAPDAATPVESPTGVSAPLRDSSRLVTLISVVALLAGAAGAFFLLRGPSERQQHAQLSRLYDEMKSLRERKAPDSEWKRLAETIKRDVMPWVESLDRTEASNGPASRALLEAGRDHLLPMLGESRRKPGAHEAEYLRCLEEARAALDGEMK